MTFVYLKLAFVGILGGCLMFAAGLGLHWQGAAAVLVGGVALGLGVRHVRASAAPTPEASSHGPSEPPAAQASCRPSPVLAKSAVWPRHLPNQIDAASDGAGFVVGYGDYLSSILVTDDPWRLPRGQQLALALQASPGADAATPTQVDHESVSGLMEDYFVRYECRLGATPANVLALRATRLAWTAAAERLAAPVDPQAEAVAAVQETMAALARRQHDRFQNLLGRQSEEEPNNTADRRLWPRPLG